jgi:hypothetical protein
VSIRVRVRFTGSPPCRNCFTREFVPEIRVRVRIRVIVRARVRVRVRV